MSAADHDPIDELRKAWKQVAAPDAASPSKRPALANTLAATLRELTPAAPHANDPQTQAAISWMRAAVHAIEVPPQPAPPIRRPYPWLTAAVAASLVLAGLALTRLALTPGASPKPPIIARAPAEPETPPPQTGRPARLTKTGIELRSGAVRLLLIPPPDTTNTTEEPK